MREAIVVNTTEALLDVVEAIFYDREFEIVSCQNLFRGEFGRVDGYRQITLKVRLCCMPMLLEIEVHHDELFKCHYQSAINGYRRYTDLMSAQRCQGAIPFADCKPADINEMKLATLEPLCITEDATVEIMQYLIKIREGDDAEMIERQKTFDRENDDFKQERHMAQVARQCTRAHSVVVSPPPLSLPPVPSSSSNHHTSSRGAAA